MLVNVRPFLAIFQLPPPPQSAFSEETAHISTLICYHTFMRNWDYNLDTAAPGKDFDRWQLERMINYGLKPNEKLPIDQLRKYLNQLNIEPARQRFLEFILWKN